MDQLDITQSLNHHLGESLSLLRRLVDENSFTASGPGVDRVGELVVQAFAPLGFAAQRIPSVTPGYGSHTILSRTGSGARTIGLVAHLDTVFPADEEKRNRFAWRESGDRIHGPGILDDKGGIAMIHLMLTTLRECEPELFGSVTWEVLLDSSEETLADDFRDMCVQRLSGKALACLVFEPGNTLDGAWTAAVSRKGIAEYRYEVTGHGAHAGSSHRQGANAILQAAEIVRALSSFTDYPRGLTFNPGAIAGGTVTNRVPHQAEVRGEMRAFLPEVFAEGLDRLHSLEGEGPVTSPDGRHPCTTLLHLGHQTPPWPRNPATERLLDIWINAAAQCGIRLVGEDRGGLSDGNRIWNHVPTIDGLGPLGANAHCSEYGTDGSDQEYVVVSSFVPKTLINILALKSLVAAS